MEKGFLNCLQLKKKPSPINIMFTLAIIVLNSGNLLRHQQLHDPSGNSKKKKLELKNGRAKRVHMVNGQKVEVLPSDDHGLVEEIDDPGRFFTDREMKD